MSLSLRTADTPDAEAINDILNHYVLTSTATFLLAPQTAAERVAWLEGRSISHPVIVAEDDGMVVGWSALSHFRVRAAYAKTAEIAVYVRHDMHHRGIGRALIRELIARARAADLHAMVAGVCSESTASIALFESLGFAQVAHFHEVGRKFDRWLDVLFLELIL